MFAPPEQDSPILKALNNDCLYAVFKWLNSLDLMNVAKVCVRFQSQAVAAFSSKYKHLELKRRKCDQDEMKSVLSEFGPYIQSLSILSNRTAADSVLLPAIIQNCTSELKVLRLANINIQVDSPDLRLPFPKLEELELLHCDGKVNLLHLNEDCPELTKISLTYGILKGVDVLFSHEFKKLERLHLCMLDGRMNDAVVERFITLNPTLIELTIKGSLQTSRAIRLVGQNMLRLKTIALTPSIDNLEHFQSDVQHIGHLRSLKSLRLDFNGQEATPLAKVLAENHSPMEDFEIIRACFENTAIDWISQLQEINTLNMAGAWGINDEHLIRLARNLSKLHELRLVAYDGVSTIAGIIQMFHYAKNLSIFQLICRGYSEMTVNLDDYNNMLDMIRNWPHFICTYLEIYGERIRINVPKEIVEENRHILNIYKENHLCDEIVTTIVFGQIRYD